MTKRNAVAEDLHRSALRLLRRLRKADETLEISTARLSALSVLVFVGPQSVGGLARIEQVSQPTMTSLTQGMIRQGLIRAKPDPNDRRVRRLVATAKGKKLLHRGRQKRIEMLSSMLQRFNVEELQMLARAATLMESMLLDEQTFLD
ncbi:MAG: MarR family transcriptional regulator [Phycisphaerae bacterium]|nr:MAG: MarR family transcriptional regulator [Phycisphaerae bacterium]